MRRREIFIIIFLLVIIFGAIYGLWYFSKSPSPKPKEERELEKFFIGLDEDIEGIYPKTKAEAISESVNWEIFRSLARFDREGRLVPDLAEYWVNLDNLTWEIYLKKGIKFQNGMEMKAEDVKFSIIDLPEKIKDFHRRENLALIEKVEIVDPYRIKVFTKNPHPLLMVDLSSLAILSRDYIEKNGFDAPPIGTGPYKFKSWEKGKEIILERFEDFYGKKPIAKKVIYKVIPKEEERIEALLKGEVNFITNLTLDGIEKIENANGVKPAITPLIGVTFLAMNTREKNPLSDQRVRKAIAYAIDKEKIIEEVFKGKAKIATQLSPLEAFGYNPKIKFYPQDLNEARRLLNEAGYPQGLELKFLSPDDERAKVSQIISNQLKEIKIETKLFFLPRGEFFEKLSTLEADLFILTLLDNARDVANLASTLYHTKTKERGTFNFVGYSNGKVDELIEKAMTTLNQKERKKYAQEINGIVIEEDLPYLPLYVGELLAGVSKDLDFSYRPDSTIVLEDLSFSK